MSASTAQTAEELKELGNQAFAAKKFKEAADYYTAALNRIETSGGASANSSDARHILFSNRSAAHAGLQDWTAAIQDAKECIRLDPSFLKGYYRLATALASVQDFAAALNTIRQGLTMDAHHPQLLQLLRTVQQQQQRAAAASSATAGNAAPVGAASLPSPGDLQWDEATRREWEDLQIQHSKSMREYAAVEQHLLALQRQARVHAITQQELQQLIAQPTATAGATSSPASERKVYKSVGKMFYRAWTTPKDAVQYLDQQVQDVQKQETDLGQKMEYLERRIKSQRQNMEELLGPAAQKASSATVTVSA